MSEIRPPRGPILVTGATGQQGGAVARSLLQRGYTVRAMTRNPDSDKARALAALGAEIVFGDFEDRVSLDWALDGMYGAFSVQNPYESGTERETVQGIAFAEAARRARIKHLVYSSVGGAERQTGIAHFESKWRVEERLRQLKIPHTILRPVFFIENLFIPGEVGAFLWGALAGSIGDSGTIQVISVADIGEFAAIAFDNPGLFKGQAIELAGDEVTLEQATYAYREVTGEPPRYQALTPDTVRTNNEDWGDMFAWFQREGYHASIPALRFVHPDLRNLSEGLELARGDAGDETGGHG